MREIEIVATEDGIHWLLFGFNAGEMSGFSMQLYIEHFGKRSIDFLQALSLGYMSFMGGDIWKHNSDEVPRANFFGEQKDAKIGIAINEKPEVVKILDSLGIHTDGTWEVESVVVAPSLNHPSGMYSVVPRSLFKKREGVLYSEFLRNMKTSGSTIKAIEAITGEELRSNAAYMILKHTGGDNIQIWKLDINMTSSR